MSDKMEFKDTFCGGGMEVEIGKSVRDESFLAIRIEEGPGAQWVHYFLSSAEAEDLAKRILAQLEVSVG